MVSKTPTKAFSSSSKAPVRRLRRSATKNKAAKSSPSPLKSIAATINRSVRSCRRRLIKVFARLTILGAADGHLRFRRLNSSPTKDRCSPSPPPLAPITSLPLPTSPDKKTIFLDLDETLIHSTTDPAPEHYDFAVHPMIDGRVVPFYVLKRPGADDLLRAAAESFEVVVFTAGLREYASLVLDRLDPWGELISHRLYRDACKETEGRFVKDLSAVGRALDRVVLVDDNPNAYLLQPENALPVAPFSNDLGDQELRKVMEFFEVALLFEDMRDAVAYYRSKCEDQKVQN